MLYLTAALWQFTMEKKHGMLLIENLPKHKIEKAYTEHQNLFWVGMS